MIEKATSFKVGDRFFETIEDAQAHEIACMIASAIASTSDPDMLGTAAIAAKHLVANKAKVLDILTTTESSKPKARKINGGTKKRKPVVAQAKPEATEEKPPF